MAQSHTDLVREVLADPYDLEFLAIDPAYSERQLEDALVARLTAFLTELGQGFAFVGRQYRSRWGIGSSSPTGFFHLGLRRFVSRAEGQLVEPVHVGQPSFYVAAVDDQLRRPDGGDGPTMGSCRSPRDDVVVEYALRTRAHP